MKKAPEAFRTISEVAELLHTPAHVLRFWETKFHQIRPVKRAGGRRFYRPDDIALLNGIRILLQEQGHTIGAVQRLLQEKGVRHVIAIGATPPSPEETEAGSDPSAHDEAKHATPAGSAKVRETLAPTSPSRHEGDGALRTRGAAPAERGAEAHAWLSGDAAAYPQSRQRSPHGDPLPASASVEQPNLPLVPLPHERTTGRSGDADLSHDNTEAVGSSEEMQQAEQRPAQPEQSKGPKPMPAELETSAEAEPRLAALLRNIPPETALPLRPRLLVIAQRIDRLLDRMAEASGTSRW